MTDYLDEALEGLDALVRRLRRIEASAERKEVNIEYSNNIGQKIQNSNRKSQNVSEIGKAVDGTEFTINRSLNRVYDLDKGGRTSPLGAAGLDSGGSKAILRSAELEDAPTMRGEGRDSGPVPPGGPDAGWISGEGTEIQAPAEWLSGGEVKASAERDGEWSGGSVSPRGPETGWLPGGTAEARTPAGETGASAVPMSEETRWAEQADRAFRRDSRRYDGGFYLY